MLTIAAVDDSVLELIGHTPMVDVSSLSPNPGASVSPTAVQSTAG